MMSDNDGKEIALKNVETMQDLSLQARARAEGSSGRLPLLLFLARAGQTVPPWWSKERDRELDRFWKSEDHVSGAFYTLGSKLASVPFRIEPRDASVALHRKQAEEYQELLEAGSEFGAGWQELADLFLQDIWTQDNGAFLEVIGAGPKDGPIRGLPVGLAHLDSLRCHRTGSLEYPVQYEDTDGKLYKLHRSRVLFRSQLPSRRAEMYRVGFCWLSRCINAAQSLLDNVIYKQEKMGSRPKRGIVVTGGGLDPDDVASAFAQTDLMQDAQGLSRYSKFTIVGANYLPDARLELMDMASLPDGFDYETDMTLTMFTIALAGGFPPRWIWPASVTGATKADAMYQHVAGLTGGPGATLQMLATMLGGPERGGGLLPGSVRFLPPQLRMVFDFQDDEQDRAAAEIRNVRSQARERDVNDSVLNVRVARQQMLADGEIDDAEFEEMELADGRLPDGSDVLALFQSDDPQLMPMLVVDPEMASDEEIRIRIDEDWALVLNAPRATIKRKARQAIAALEALLDGRRVQPLEEARQVEEEPPADEKFPLSEEDQIEEDPFVSEVKSVEDFGLSVRAAARILWRGEDPDAFFFFVDTLNSAVFRHYEQAWQEGAKTCGILPADRTPEEQAVLAEYISIAQSRILPLGDFISANSRANGGKWGDLQARLNIWINRYGEVLARAQQMSCKDTKLKWRYGDTKHCSSCLKLNGRVYRASIWQKYNIYPRMHELECRGFNCQCRFEVTTEPVTPGRPPDIP